MWYICRPDLIDLLVCLLGNVPVIILLCRFYCVESIVERSGIADILSIMEPWEDWEDWEDWAVESIIVVGM